MKNIIFQIQKMRKYVIAKRYISLLNSSGVPEEEGCLLTPSCASLARGYPNVSPSDFLLNS